jgi:ubiquinone biosynthesis protein COQ4
MIVKSDVGMQTGLPMTAASVAAGLAKVKPKQREMLTRELLPWATRAGLQCTDLMTIMYEDHIHADLEQLRKQWRVIVAPSRVRL